MPKKKKLTSRTENLQCSLKHVSKEFSHVLEFGVYTGKTCRFIRKTLDKSYEMFAFDSFEGLPEYWPQGDLKAGFFSVKGAIPDVDNVTFHKGWFEDTIHDYLKDPAPIAFLHIDSDLISSATLILESLNDYIVPGTVIHFDDWFCQGQPNESVAFDEWAKLHNREVEFITLTSPRKAVSKSMKVIV